jgi:hypothetical protein
MKNRLQRKPRWLSWVYRFLVLVIGVALTGPVAFAQGTPPKSYLNKGTVHLPIQIDDRVRPQLQEVQLFVKEGAQAPWVMKEKVPATQTFFTFRTTKEGEYWFNVATVDRNGKSVPADVNQEPPGLIVVIDSTPPQVEAQFQGATPEGQQVRCEIRDANPDPVKTRFFYQTRDQVWRPLDAVNGQPDTFNIPAQAALTGMIRVTACDLAGNATTREFNLSALQVANAPAPAPAAAPAPTSAPKLPNVIIVESPNEKVIVAPPPLLNTSAPTKVPGQTVVISETIVPFNERVEFIANKLSPAAPPTRPSVGEQAPKAPFAAPSGNDIRPIPEKIAAAGSTPPAIQPDVPAKRHLVNNPHVYLDYQIEQTGVSGVGRVEVWYTRDNGQSYQKLGEDSNRKGQAEIDLPGEGVYGVTIVVANGRGFGANPPQTGDTPDWWIEVDTTKPRAELLNVQSNPSGDDGSLHISWSAKDKNLHSEPIDLFYAVNRQGPWLPIAKGLKNDGLYRWTPSPDIGSHAYVRLTVRDQAGNTASSESVHPVALDDLSRPRGRVVGITTIPRTAPSISNGPTMLPPQGN